MLQQTVAHHGARGFGEEFYKALEAAGYTGLVGYELFPARSTREAVKAILDAG